MASVLPQPDAPSLGHQEVQRLLEELEAVYLSTETEWLDINPIRDYLIRDLGYEDNDELEDALKTSFENFVNAMPNCELRKVTEENKEEKIQFRMKRDPERSEWPKEPRVLTYKVKSRANLWNIVHKSPNGTFEIPHMEFEISADGKRRIDTVYNHIGAAIFNLGSHVGQNKDLLPADQHDKMTDCIIELNKLLDVEHPFEIRITDPSGVSEFTDDTDVTETGGYASDEEEK